MKLKCVYSGEEESKYKFPAFMVGKEYEIYDKKGDVYYVITENGTYIDIVLNGCVWKFKPIEDEKEEDEKEEREEKEDILFEIESLINQLNNEFNKLKKLI